MSAVSLGLLFAAGAVLAWALARLWRIAAIGASYKAKVLSSIVFGAGRDVDGRAPEVSADSYWPMRFVRTTIDRGTRTVTASLAGLRPRSATYPEDLVWREVAPAGVWRETQGSARLQAVVNDAFGEPDPSRLRRTRAVVVVQDGAIVAERYAPGFTADSRLPGWSMTKSVMSALTGVLVGAGRLSLDDRELLPEWKAPDPRAAISLEDLLRMRSGLAFTEVYEDFSSDVVEMLFNQSDTAAYAASRPLASTPGTVWSYASGTSNIVSAILRRTLGEAAYRTWPRDALFGPLGMASAVIESDTAGTFVGSSFMLATARDWARFGQLYLQDGVWEGRQLLPAGWVSFSTTTTPGSEGLYGAHWWLGLKPELGGGTPAAARIPSDAYYAVGHEMQTITVIPSRRLVIVRLGLSIYIDAWNHAAFVASVLDAL